jgi:integrase
MLRGRVFYLRLRVPRSLQKTVGRTHVWKSLGTSKRHEAVRAARIVGWEFEQRFRAAEGQDVEPITGSIPSTIPAKAATTRIDGPTDKTIDDVFRLFLADPAKARSRKTEMHYETLNAIVTDVWGRGRVLRSIDREACRDLLEVLRWLPSNPTKRFPKLTTVQAADMAKAKKLASTLSAASVNGYMTKLRSVFNFAVNEGWLDRNPARGLRVADPVRRRDKRLPFSNDQLHLIFNAPLYTGCADDWHGYATPGSAFPRRGRFWVPLIAIFAGLRLNEACQLDVSDIQTVEGVDCISVSGGMAAAETEKRLKTASSERLIPIHPSLREIGFMMFVEGRRAAGGKKLFPELQASPTGYFSDPFSKWFRRFLAKAGAARPRTCFHSFRHCYRDALREARIDHEIALALGGWASGNGKDGAETAAAYGRGYRVETLSAAIAKVSYPGLDLSHLMAVNSPRPMATEVPPS